MKITVPQLEITESDGFSPEIDIFERRHYGESLLNLIKNSDDEIVVALDSPWGEGKSTFIKMWQGHLKQNNIQSIYFDAFENDYVEDPFLALSSQIYELIDNEDEDAHKEFKEKAVSAVKVIGRAGLRVGIKALTAGILDETVLDDIGGVKDASKETSDLVDNYISNQISKAQEDRENLAAFKDHLMNLASEIGNGHPLVFIIDELDRCKPKFALSLIESIKHLFSVKNIQFVLVMNRVQLEEAVKCEYGAGVDASRYLQKFVTLWTSLPKSKDEYNSTSAKYLSDCLKRMDFIVQNNTENSTFEYYRELIEYYNLSLREIERSLTNFAIIQNATERNLNSDYSCISVFIAIIKVVKPEVYRKLINENISYQELVHEASLDKLEASYFSDKPEKHPIRWLLRYYLSSDEEAQALLEQGNYLSSRSTFHRDAVKSVSLWLEAFKR